MNTMNEFFRQDWAQALGWTFLHSLWQSLLIIMVILTCLRVIPSVHARLRYGITCIGLFVAFVLSLATFTLLYTARSADSSPIGYSNTVQQVSVSAGADAPVLEHTLSAITSFLETNIPFILTTWTIGFMIFGLRFFGGLWYIRKLRQSAIPLQARWTSSVERLRSTLGISKAVKLAESVYINTPMVIGYLKPIILIPVGMISGLSTEEVETIFIHELAHIKRHDYLINLFQSFMEMVFFFNPFIWTLSNHLRKEREYCCDDIVISQHGSSLAYAHALARLEEVRLSNNPFALGLAENKNVLLDRIKRIMEKSAKNYSGKDRMIIPAILLVAGLLCASWLSIHQENRFQEFPANEQDTSVKKDSKSAKFSQKRIITIDENGQPHEEIIREFDGDEELRPLVELNVPTEVAPLIPPPALNFPLHPIAPDVDLNIMIDTIPPIGSFDMDTHEWEEFAKAFEENFREKFESFYESHEKELEEMMKDLESKFKSLESRSFDEQIEHFNLTEEHLEAAQEAQEQAMEALRNIDLDHTFEHLHEGLEKLEHFDMEPFSDIPDQFFNEANFKEYERALRKALVEDGYLKGTETVNSMEWNDGSFKVNGKEIKKEDQNKYRALHDKYLDRGHAGKVE
jgi:beta-lactamase regulating signal transducer with metallopeptidase domain